MECNSPKKLVDDRKKASADEAARKPQEAEAVINDIDSILINSLDVNHSIIWDSLKDKSDFKEPYPSKPAEPELAALPVYPEKVHRIFSPNLIF